MLMTLDDRMDCTGFGDGYTTGKNCLEHLEPFLQVQPRAIRVWKAQLFCNRALMCHVLPFHFAGTPT